MMKDKTETNKLNKNSSQPELTQLTCDLAPQKEKQTNLQAWGPTTQC